MLVSRSSPWTGSFAPVRWNSYEAVLLKWQYNGKIGPAKVDDVQYRLLAEDVGTVAMVEKKNVSAMLVYNEHVNIGSVLVAKK